jgi:hypothetical protein
MEEWGGGEDEGSGGRGLGATWWHWGLVLVGGRDGDRLNLAVERGVCTRGLNAGANSLAGGEQGAGPRGTTRTWGCDEILDARRCDSEGRTHTRLGMRGVFERTARTDSGRLGLHFARKGRTLLSSQLSILPPSSIPSSINIEFARTRSCVLSAHKHFPPPTPLRCAGNGSRRRRSDILHHAHQIVAGAASHASSCCRRSR